jgi:hypothetical protein
MFMGCVDAEAGPEGEETTLFDLQEVIGDLDAGYIDDWGSVFDNTPFQKCGSPDVQIIVDGGKKKLKIDNMQNGWGEGVDLYNNSDGAKNIVGVGFKAGDEVYIKGTINPVGNGLKLTNGGGKPRFGDGWLGDASFDQTITLKAADIADIKGASPAAVRISYSDPDGDARKGTIIIEELTVKGLRKAGEGAEPPLDFSVPGHGKYKVPASSGLDIYVDLNNAVFSTLNPHFADAKIEGPNPADTADKTGKLTVSWYWDQQGIFFPFTDEVKSLIVSAARLGYNFDVTINGTHGGGWNRWCLGADRTGSWNITNMVGGNTNDTFNAVQTLTVGSGGSNNLPDEITGIVMQCRPNNNNQELPVGSKYTSTITSIKITLKDTGAALTPLTGTNAITLEKPGAGRVAEKSITGTNFKGLVTWYPELPRSGRFEYLKEYRAEIAIFPNAGYTTNETTNFQVDSVKSVYNAATRVVSTIYFPSTKAINELSLGKIFDLQSWITGTTVGWKDPLMQAGGPTFAFDNTDGAKKITVTNVVNNWDGIDIQLKKVDAGVNQQFNKVSVVVTGKILGLNAAVEAYDGRGGQMRLQGNPGYDGAAYSTSALAVGATFTLTIAEITTDKTYDTLRIIPAAAYAPNAGDTDHDIHDIPYVSSFEITSIIITNLGDR